ncbi:hypothetical protein [Sphaerisporangium album]|uniref:hypothetical protein n=1 Tax=Sphaerisporangium album TaxID=509200 RepID=UPI001FE52F04|nr:hypothetical protein [Sphaerisporangium album]
MRWTRVWQLNLANNTYEPAYDDNLVSPGSTSPAGNRLYFSSQRGSTGSSSGGITYCVTGPFRP